MNSEALNLIFRAKNLRREELAKMPLSEKVRLIEALHAAGMRLRSIRPQVGSVGVSVHRSQPSAFEEVSEFEPVRLDDMSELITAA